MHGHLLALEGWRDTTHEDHGLYVFELCDEGVVVDGLFLCDVNLHVGTPCLHELIANLDVEALSGSGLQSGACGGGAPGVDALFAFAVDIDLIVAAAFDIDDILAGGLGREGRLILGREILDGHAGGEVVHTGCGHGNGRGVELCRHGLALHLGVVPEGAAQALLAVDVALGGQTAVHDQGIRQVAAGEVT